MSIHAEPEFKRYDSSQDPSMILSKQRVEEAKSDTSGRVYRVYCDGVFDLFHLGHMRMLEQAKKALGAPEKTFLICGVCSDELVNKYKGKTVMAHDVRCNSARHCKWVDEVLEDAPWVLTDDYLKKHLIDFVAHDAIPYQDNSGAAANSTDVYGHIKAKGMFLETQRTEGLSTSDIIVAIIRDYDDYVLRNLDRGYTKDQLNVGKSWAVRSKWHEKQKKVKTNLDGVKTSFREAEDAAAAFISEFNPRYLLQRSDSQQHVYFSPRNYVTKLRENLPAKSKGLWYHSVGLTKAVYETTCSVLSYFNPLSYRQQPRKKE